MFFFKNLPLYACVGSVFYFADNMHAPIFVRDVQILFVVYNYLFVEFNILFVKGYIFVHSSTYIRTLSQKILKKIKFFKYS